MGESAAQAARPEAAALLRKQCEAITAAITAGCAVMVNIRGVMQRVTHLVTDGEAVTLVYSGEDRRSVLFRVRPGARIDFRVTLSERQVL
ncbi:MAG TPA: hypothetical protein VNE61_08655 [Ktedonobacteraceae bacterium]|nr:hypothetical protein [Ktedonobacteraceae bacterium]